MFGLDGGRRMYDKDTTKPVRTSETIWRLMGYFRGYWPVLLLVAGMIIANTWTQVITPQLTGQAVDCYLTPGALTGLAPNAPVGELPAGAPANFESGAETNCQLNIPALGLTPVPAGSPTSAYVAGLARLVLALVGIYIMGSIMGGLQFFLMSWTGQHVIKGLRTDIFAHIHELSLNYYSENEAGQIMSRVTNDVDTISQAFGFALINVLGGVLLLVWIAINMLRDSIPYALISLSIVPVMWLVTNWFSNQARRAFRRSRQEIGRVNADLQEGIAGVREVQAFNREDANIESFRASNAANRDANVRATAFTAGLSPALEALGYLAIAITTVTGGLVLLSGQNLFGTVMSLGLIITFLGYVQRFNQPIQQISVLWTNLQSAVAGAERIFGLLDEIPDVQAKPDAVVLPPITGHVVFDHVNAAYKVGEPVLCDVSFAAEPGQTIAIVGPTGAGKTTIINLIPRFYDATDGAVQIDGFDVRNVTLDSLRSQIGIVLQDSFLFSESVMENIRFGKPDATDDEVKAAAKLANADEFIQRLPQGYDTVLGERGSGVSLGQRQLLAIARAALANPRILILDEATSSVDTRTERQIQRALDELLHGRTSFVIAHRLSTIRNADQVLVLEDGEIVERGVHDELLAKQGAYYRLYMKQFRGQEENGAKASMPDQVGGLSTTPAAA